MALRVFEPSWVLAAGATAGVVALVVLAAQVPGLAEAVGYAGWFVWAALVAFVVRVDHPPVPVPEPLTPARRALGWACIVLFVLTFSVRPILVVAG